MKPSGLESTQTAKAESIDNGNSRIHTIGKRTEGLPIESQVEHKQISIRNAQVGSPQHTNLGTSIACGNYQIPKTMLKGGMSVDTAINKINSGNVLYQEIISGTTHNPLSKDDAANLIWFLEYKACSKNQNFMSKQASTLRIPDTDKKIYEALKSVDGGYDRAAPGKSSHFKSVSDIQETQHGLDFPSGILPFGSRTLLLATWPDNNCTYIKLESRGINSGLLDTIVHGINFLRKLNRKVDKEYDFRENSIQLLGKELQKYKKHGKTVFQIKSELDGSDLEEFETKFCSALTSLRTGESTHLDTRLGSELILDEQDLQTTTEPPIGYK